MMVPVFPFRADSVTSIASERSPPFRAQRELALGPSTRSASFRPVLLRHLAGQTLHSFAGFGVETAPVKALKKAPPRPPRGFRDEWTVRDGLRVCESGGGLLSHPVGRNVPISSGKKAEKGWKSSHVPRNCSRCRCP